MDGDTPGWHFMHDGALFGMFNHQDGSRGGDEFPLPNWWMGMLTRDVGESRLTLTGMVSLEPATVGEGGYRELFQVGEAYKGRPLIDHQHPHDFFMQLGAIWRTPLSGTAGLTIAGGPVAEPALGPVAFMHRPSAADLPMAPLSHHTFDSTHVAFGVVTAAIDWGPWVFEGSVFNGREPDEHRWDFDFGALDSLSGRVWFRPSERWELQASTGHLKNPEELEPGDVQRTTASVSWFTHDERDYTAVTAGYGVNASHGSRRQAAFVEATKRFGTMSVFGRAEAVEVETSVLVNDAIPAVDDAANRTDTVGAFTMGAMRDLVRWHGIDGGLGAAVTLYAVPQPLTVTHGAHPVSFQLFFRLRPARDNGQRMWNMRMSQPMSGHAMNH